MRSFLYSCPYDSVVFFPIDTVAFKQTNELYLPNVGDTLFIESDDSDNTTIITAGIFDCTNPHDTGFLKSLQQPILFFFGQYICMAKVIGPIITKNAPESFVFRIRHAFKRLPARLLCRKRFLKCTNQDFDFDFRDGLYNDKAGKNLGDIKIDEVFTIDGHTMVMIQRNDGYYIFTEIYEWSKNTIKFLYAYPMD